MTTIKAELIEGVKIGNLKVELRESPDHQHLYLVGENTETGTMIIKEVEIHGKA